MAFMSPLVNLFTNDIEAGLRFYRDLLGFVETFRTPLGGAPEKIVPRRRHPTGGPRTYHLSW